MLRWYGNGTHYNSELFSMLLGCHGDHIGMKIYHSSMYNSTAGWLFAQRRMIKYIPKIITITGSID